MKFNIFKKLKKSKGGAPKVGPSQRVMDLSSQGLSEPEIISSLRKEGYSPSDVDSAMKEALKTGAGGPGTRPGLPPRDEVLPGELLPGETAPGRPAEPALEEPLEPEAPMADAGPEAGAPGPRKPEIGHREMDRPLRSEEVERVPRMPEIPGEEPAPAEPLEEPELEAPPREAPRRSAPPFEPRGEIPKFQPRLSREAPRERKIAELRERRRREIMELTEELVEEKWVEVEDKMSEIDGKFKELNAKISGIEERISKAKWEKGGESKKIQENIDSYRDSMADINSKIEGLEKAVKSSLAPMMESMRGMSDTVKALKRKGKKKEE